VTHGCYLCDMSLNSYKIETRCSMCEELRPCVARKGTRTYAMSVCPSTNRSCVCCMRHETHGVCPARTVGRQSTSILKPVQHDPTTPIQPLRSNHFDQTLRSRHFGLALQHFSPTLRSSTLIKHSIQARSRHFDQLRSNRRRPATSG
jgi:hypothetical protein